MSYTLPKIEWTPSPNYSSRGGQKTRLIVVHDCEGSYAGSVSWFSQARSRVSAHLVLSEDGTRATQMVAYANKGWHACDFNPFSEGLEMGGYTAKGFDAPEWDAAAAVVAWRLKVNGLKPIWAKGGQGEGFESHYGLGAAGGGHFDPTTDTQVWSAFVARVQAADGVVSGDDVHHSTLPPAPAPAAPAGFKPHGGVRNGFAVGSIEWLQAELNALGVSWLTVDGIEGSATAAAIARYQKSRGLYVDGIAGPNTLAALEKDAAA